MTEQYDENSEPTFGVIDACQTAEDAADTARQAANTYSLGWRVHEKSDGCVTIKGTDDECGAMRSMCKRFVSSPKDRCQVWSLDAQRW